jgi:hypothetical protein
MCIKKDRGNKQKNPNINSGFPVEKQSKIVGDKLSKKSYQRLIGNGL